MHCHAHNGRKLSKLDLNHLMSKLANAVSQTKFARPLNISGYATRVDLYSNEHTKERKSVDQIPVVKECIGLSFPYKLCIIRDIAYYFILQFAFGTNYKNTKLRFQNRKRIF